MATHVSRTGARGEVPNVKWTCMATTGLGDHEKWFSPDLVHEWGRPNVPARFGMVAYGKEDVPSQDLDDGGRYANAYGPRVDSGVSGEVGDDGLYREADRAGP